MNLLDLIIICIFIFNIAKGYNNGFFKTLYKTFWIFIVWYIYPFISNLFLQTGFAKDLKLYLKDNIHLDGLESIAEIKTLVNLNILSISQIEDGLINLVFVAMTFILVVFFINILMMVFYKTSKIILKFPPLSLVNKLGGMAIGCVVGFFNNVIFVMIVFVTSMFENFSFLKNTLDSALVKTIIDNGVVINFIERSIKYYEQFF